MGVIACKNSDGHKCSSSSHKLLISAQVSIFPQLMRLSIDKGRVIVNITVNVWIRSAGTRELDGRAQDDLVEWAELFGGYHRRGQAGVVRAPLSFLFLYLGCFFIAVSGFPR